MAGALDESDFVDTDFQETRGKAAPPAGPSAPSRPPSKEELDSRAVETQQRLEELRRLQQQLEQQRVALEEARRRRTEYHTGREEMLEHLTRGVGLLEKAEFEARRDAEEMARTLADLREYLEQVRHLNDQEWTQENYPLELTQALTLLENARMEWNAARLRWPLLSGSSKTDDPPPAPAQPLTALPFGTLCRLGFALTWPVAVVALVALVVFALALFLR